MTKKHTLNVLGHDIANESCDYCIIRDGEINYTVSHRSVQELVYKAEPKPKFETPGVISLCSQCCTHIALGMLRDVAALRVGEDRAQAEYVKLLEKHGR